MRAAPLVAAVSAAALATSASAEIVYDSNTTDPDGFYSDYPFTVQSETAPSGANAVFFGDDYFTTFSDDDETAGEATAERFYLDSLNFVGGVVQDDPESPTQQGMTLFFDFHEFTTNAEGQVTGIVPTPVEGFSVTFQGFGIGNYNIPLDDLDLQVPEAGAIVMSTDAETTGDWWLSGNDNSNPEDPAVPVGFNFSNILAFESGPDTNGDYFPQLFSMGTSPGILAFRLDGSPIPEPATAGLALIAGLGLLRRRRA